jgi:adenylate cyclase
VLILSTICLVDATKWLGKPFAGFFMNRRHAVSSSGMSQWTGFRAGLRPADKIVEIDGIPVKSVRDLKDAVTSKLAGESIQYSVKRGEQVFVTTAPTEQFSLFDLLMTFGTTFLQGIIYLAIGAIVFALKPDTAISWLFFGASALQGITCIIDFSVVSSETPLSYLLIFSDSLIPALLMNFSFLFPLQLEFVSRRPWILRIPYAFSFLIFLPLAMIYPSSLFYKCYFPLIYPYLYGAIFCFMAALLYSYFKNLSTLARQRARLIFWGALIAFPLPLLAALMLNTGHTGGVKTFTNFTAIPIIIFPIAIAYSITKHNLFDVDVYIRRAVGYGLMTAIVGTTYFALQITVKSVIFAPILGSSAEYVYPVIFALFVVFLFNPLNRMVQDVVDKVFFRRKFDYKEAVLTISNALSSVLNLEEVVHQINHAVRSEMFIDASGVIIMDSAHKGYRGYFESEDDSSGANRVTVATVPESDPLLELVCREKKLITKYDIAEDPRYSAERQSCGSRFDELDASLAIPLIYQDKVNAVITVGHKKSGHYFTKEDIELLSTLAGHGAVSIENARMAEQMQKEEIVRTNLSRYLSPQIVEGIVKSDVQVNLGGDRKVVTVLFSDIRDFTSITESRPPDQLVRLLNEYFTGMAEVIFANQGSLDKYIGDAIVAVFGSLIPLENPEMNAVKASIEMMQKLEELNRIWTERGDFPMYMGIGVNTGEVFLGNIGSQERMEFTVIGDTVNVASRFSGLAKGGQILATKSALAGLDATVRIKELPPSPVKGKAELQEVYEVVYREDPQ